jgi:hypothetical protein
MNDTPYNEAHEIAFADLSGQLTSLAETLSQANRRRDDHMRRFVLARIAEAVGVAQMRVFNACKVIPVQEKTNG